MASIRIDVELDEFDTDELLQEIALRWKRTKDKHKEEFKKDLREAFEDLIEQPKYQSMMDNMKFEIFDAKKDSKTLDEIERFFNG